MKLENQFNTHEQGVKLYNYGINASQFKHSSTAQGEYIGLDHHTVFDTEHVYMPAFSVAELGVMLPQTIKLSGSQKASVRIFKMNAFTIVYYRHSSDNNIISFESKIEAQARAAMLIYLLENNLTTPEEVNQRLNNA